MMREVDLRLEEPQLVANSPLESAFLYDDEIHRLKKRIKKMEEKRDMLLESSFKKGITQEGQYALAISYRRTRTPDIKAMAEAYPDILDLVKFTISLPAADKAIGQANVDRFCEMVTTRTYKVKYISPGVQGAQDGRE